MLSSELIHFLMDVTQVIFAMGRSSLFKGIGTSGLLQLKALSPLQR